MTRISVQLPAGDAINLDVDLDATTVAAVKAAVDARLESIWRASGVRILRSDLPFCGITLRYQNRPLVMDKVLSSCRVGADSTLYAQWPQKSEKDERRKRYGKGWGDETALERRRRKKEKGLKRAEREKKPLEKKALRQAPEKKTSGVVENTAQTAPETDEDEQISSVCVLDDGPGDGGRNEAEVEAEGGWVDDEGAHGINEEVAGERNEQQAEDGGQVERPTREAERDDPFADEDSDKENREPTLVPVVEDRADEYPVEEWSAYDEGHSGLGVDLLEEVLEF